MTKPELLKTEEELEKGIRELAGPLSVDLQMTLNEIKRFIEDLPDKK